MTELATTGSDTVEIELANRGTLVIPSAMIEAYPALNPALDLDDLLEGALGPGGELRLSDLTKIKVPSAELKRLMVPDEDGEPAPVAELHGVVVAMTSRRSWWPDATPSGKPPSCSSRDLEHGVGEYGPGSAENPSGKCADCPMSQPGSMSLINPQREGNASACKEQRLLFVLTDRELLPMMLIVPPGSLQGHKKFGVGLAKRGVVGPIRPEAGTTASGRPARASAWLAVELGISLEQKTNATGQDYNALVFKQVRKLSAAEQEVISVYGMQIDELIAKQADALDTVAADAATNPVDATGATDVEFDADGMPVDEVDLSGVGGKGDKGR
jgi:hypothetical protein